MALRGEVAILSYLLILGVTGLTAVSLQFTDSLVDSTVPITGYITSPNSAPTLSTLSASTYSVRAGDYLTIYSTASDAGDTIQLQCASAPDTNPAYRLCTSSYFSSNPSCTFQVPKVPAGSYNVYCAAYDGAAYSSISAISVTMIDTPLTVYCVGEPSTILAGQTVTWTAAVGGGIGSYTYSWTGTDALSGASQQIQKIYSTGGSKSATVTVTSGSETKTQYCGSVNVQAITTPPSCSAYFSPSTVLSGQSTTAYWSSENDYNGLLPYSCTGNLGSGVLSTPSGTLTVTPAQTQTCYFDVENAYGKVSCAATVNVQPPASPPSCSVSPSGVSLYAGNKAAFSVSYSNDADGWISYNCIGDGTGYMPVPASLGGNGNTPTAGSGFYNELVPLNVPGTYPCTLTVQNSAGATNTCSITFNVIGATCSDGTSSGACSVTKPKYCSGSTGLVDNCQLCGCPSGSTCQASGSCSATSVPPTVNIKANNQDSLTLTSGTTVALSWTSSGATSCTASGAWSGAKDLSGYSYPFIDSSKTYTITCVGTSGSATDSVTVNVGSTPRTTEYAPDGGVLKPSACNINSEMWLSTSCSDASSRLEAIDGNFAYLSSGAPVIHLVTKFRNPVGSLQITGKSTTLGPSSFIVRSDENGDGRFEMKVYQSEVISGPFTIIITIENSRNLTIYSPTDIQLDYVGPALSGLPPRCVINPIFTNVLVGNSERFRIGYINDADGWIEYSCEDGSKGALPIPASLGGNDNKPLPGSGDYTENIKFNVLGTYYCTATVKNSAGTISTCKTRIGVMAAAPTPPGITSAYRPIEPFVGQSIKFSAATDKQATINISVSPPGSETFGLLKSCSSVLECSYTSGILSNADLGLWRYYVTAEDAAGNIAGHPAGAYNRDDPSRPFAWLEVPVRVAEEDNTLPVIFVTQSGSLTVGNTFSIYATIYDRAENLDKILIFFDDRVVKVCDGRGRGFYVDCASNLITSELLAGIHTYSVFANDTAGNVARSSVYTINVVRSDTSAPVLTVTALPEIPVPGKSLSIIATTNEESRIRMYVARPGDSDYKLVNACQWVYCDFFINLIDIDVGVWKYRVEAIDLVGNTVSKTGTLQVYSTGTAEAPLTRETINSVIQYLESIKSKGTLAASDVYKIAQYYRSTGDIESAEKYEAVLELINNGIVKIDVLRSKIIANINDPGYLKTLKPEFDAIKELANIIAENLKVIRKTT